MNKKIFKFISIFVFVMNFFCGCESKQETAQIFNWQQYEDPYQKIQFTYPETWIVQPDAGKAIIYSSQDAIHKFFDYSCKELDGARLIISIQKIDSAMTNQKIIRDMCNNLEAAGYEVGVPEKQRLANKEALQIQYSGRLDKDNQLSTIHVSAVRDSFIYTVKYEAFNSSFKTYKPVLDTAMVSLRFLVRPSKKVPDPTIPAKEMVLFENNYVKILYPANFKILFPKKEENHEFSMDIKGYRQDSCIHIDIMPAHGLDLIEVVEQNARFYAGHTHGDVSINGIDAIYLNYSPMKDIVSRVYFLVENDKVYRLILNYHATLKKKYLPVFEKMVHSFDKI